MENKKTNQNGIKELQKEILSTFNSVVKIFDNLGILHWIHSGTLLGWKRDGGFIEWDDDLDIMISYRDWINNIDQIKIEFSNLGLILFDFTDDDTNIRNRLKIARVYSTKKNIISTGDSNYETYSFIDIFFAAPVNHFNKWYKWIIYEWMYKISWVFDKGYKRYYLTNKRSKVLILNFISYPLKLLLPNKIIKSFLASPKFSNGDWSNLTRFDYWTHRKTFYDVEQFKKVSFLGVETNANSNVEKELDLTYGKNWNIKKYKIPHYKDPVSLNSNTNILIKKHLDNLQKK